ncbi:exocyst complex component Sec5-domain-containing protein [Blastocladiella britannica]|nr:exocyst complex component Sec5-domain-containing protein [Blastocladiella britannica]
MSAVGTPGTGLPPRRPSRHREHRRPSVAPGQPPMPPMPTAGGSPSRHFAPASAAGNPVISERELLALYALEDMDQDRWTDPAVPPPATIAAASAAVGAMGSAASLTGSLAGGADPRAGASAASLPDAVTGGAAPVYLDDADPLRLKPSVFRSLPRQLALPLEVLAVSHKDFDPKKFLAVVHPSASFRDLEMAMRRIDDSGGQQAEGMRSLVRDHFDEFVVAKATVDDAFRGWTERELDPATHYGTDGFSDALDIASSTASQVFRPILDRRAHADRIRSTLAVLERFKFFFNLPATLRSHVSLAGFDAAVRDYKKGRAIVVSMYPDLLDDPTMGEDDGVIALAVPAGNGQQQQPATKIAGQRALFATVWAEVSKVMAALVDQLMRQLTEQHATRSNEEQEMAIALVLDIDPRADPVWAYLESRFKWILAQLKEKVSLWYRAMPDPSTQPTPERFSDAQFRRAVMLRNKKEFDTMFGKDPEVRAWASRAVLITDLSASLASSLPDFWKLAKGYIEGKYTNKSAGGGGAGGGGGRGNRGRVVHLDLAKVEQCNRMVRDIAGYFGVLIQHTLALGVSAADLSASGLPPPSPMTPRSPPPGGGTVFPVSGHLASLPYLPPLSRMNGVTVAVYAPRIAAQLHTCADLVRGVKVPPETMASIGQAVERCKGGLLEMLLAVWMKDISLLPRLEDWSQDPKASANGGAVTMLIPLFNSLQRVMVQAAFKVARPLASDASFGGSPPPPAPGQLSVPGGPAAAKESPRLGNLVVPTFFDSVATFLDGMYRLIAMDAGGSPRDGTTATGTSSTPALWPAGNGSTPAAAADGLAAGTSTSLSPSSPLTSRDLRSLVVVCNLDHLDKTVMPALCVMVEGLAVQKLPGERAKVADIVRHLDEMVMDGIVRRAMVLIDKTIRTGIPERMDWINAPRPTEVRPWVFQTLMHLVDLHAAATSVYAQLTPRVVSAAYAATARAILQAARVSVERTGIGGLLQLTLELEMIQQVMAKFETPAIAEVFQQAYAAVMAAFRAWASSLPSGSPPIDERQMQAESVKVKEILADAMASSKMQFLCFGKTQKMK